MSTPLHALAHARAGDKGRVSTISVVCYDPADFELLLRALTPERVAAHLAAGRADVSVKRYVLRDLAAFNFVLSGLNACGVTRSLSLDAHGKSFSSLLLSLRVQS